MENQLLKDLIEKLMFDKVNTEEFACLKSEIRNGDDTRLDRILEEIWEEYNHLALPMDASDKSEILRHLTSHITEQKNKPSGVLFKQWYKIAASILFPVSVIACFYLLSLTSEDSFIVMADSGQKTHILLPDSTEVWLNSESYLSYSSKFNSDNRKVKLVGEGYFNVRKKDKKKFIVEVDNVNVIVHGTTFNVSAYERDPTIKIALESGKVQLENKRNRTIFAEMQPDQLVSISKQNMEWSIADYDAALSGIWHNNVMRFANAPMQEVYNKMERWYGMKIYVDNPNDTIRYGFIVKSESLKEMLDLINRITPIAYRIEGEEVYISYKGK